MTGEVTMDSIGYEREGVAVLLTACLDDRQYCFHKTAAATLCVPKDTNSQPTTTRERLGGCAATRLIGVKNMRGCCLFQTIVLAAALTVVAGSNVEAGQPPTTTPATTDPKSPALREELLARVKKDQAVRMKLDCAAQAT